MPSIHDALRAGHAPVHRSAAGARVWVAGGAGALGSAVVEAMLGERHFLQVSVLVTQPLNTTLPGLNPVLWRPSVAASPAGEHAPRTAVVIFDRERHANGRELPFMRPEPAELPRLAAWLKASGVRHLLIVLPHAPATLPQALKHGLANLDEQQVANLGFDHLVFMRSAQAPATVRAAHPAQRVANWVLSQLQLMVPLRDQPVRAQKVAQFAAQLAALLAASPPGTRVVPPEVVWEAAQSADLAGWAHDWLHGHARPQSRVKPMRM